MCDGVQKKIIDVMGAVLVVSVGKATRAFGHEAIIVSTGFRHGTR